MNQPDLVLKGQTQRTVPRALGRGPRELQGQMRRQAGQGGRLGHAGKPPSDARDGGGRRYRHGCGGGLDLRPGESERPLPCPAAALRSDRRRARRRAPQLESSRTADAERLRSFQVESSDWVSRNPKLRPHVCDLNHSSSYSAVSTFPRFSAIKDIIGYP